MKGRAFLNSCDLYIGLAPTQFALNASLNGSDDSLSTMSLQQLPVKGCSIWTLQFRPLILVRYMQSLLCLTQGQQGCLLTPNLCDEIAWPHDP